MEIFISWSGEMSRKVAESLAEFIEHVVPSVNTFISSQDIDVGDRWEARISAQLASSDHAILCVTKDNQESPWLNYEAGALSKMLDRSRVVPYTVGFPPGEMRVGPLSRFQGIENNEAGTWKLVQSLNNSTHKPKPEGFVREGFSLWWPRFQEQMSSIETVVPNTNDHGGPTDHELLIEMRQEIRRLIELNTPENVDVREAIDVLESALRDSLTKLANRRAFMKRASELEAAGKSFSVAYLDLDHFKQVNDSLGHAKGDELLRTVATAFKEKLPSADIIARIGGDEFTAIFQNTPPEKVVELLTRVIADLPNYTTSAGLPAIAASGGVSTDRIEPFDVKVKAADYAMYHAKQEGRGKIKLAE